MNNLLFTLALVPLLVFVVLYWQLLEGNLHGPFYGEQQISQILLISMGAIIFSEWMISFFLFNARLKPVRKMQSLGIRLDHYYSLTVIRFAIILSGSIVMAVGFGLTENQLFTVIAVSNLLLSIVLWPIPAKVCRDLQLKGDERTLVFFKKDRLH
jgi:hypothetical protein